MVLCTCEHRQWWQQLDMRLGCHGLFRFYMCVSAHLWFSNAFYRTSEGIAGTIQWQRCWVLECAKKDVRCGLELFQSQRHRCGPSVCDATQPCWNGCCCQWQELRGSNFILKFLVEMCGESSFFFLCITILDPLLYKYKSRTVGRPCHGLFKHTYVCNCL